MIQHRGHKMNKGLLEFMGVIQVAEFVYLVNMLP